MQEDRDIALPRPRQLYEDWKSVGEIDRMFLTMRRAKADQMRGEDPPVQDGIMALQNIVVTKPVVILVPYLAMIAPVLHDHMLLPIRSVHMVAARSAMQ